MKCVQKLDWHHKHSSFDRLSVWSHELQKSQYNVAFSAWWSQRFQGFSGSLYKHVCSEEETTCNETNAVPIEMHIVSFSLKNLVRLQHAVHLKVKCVISVPFAPFHRFYIEFHFNWAEFIAMIFSFWQRNTFPRYLLSGPAFADSIQKSPRNVSYLNRKQEVPPTNIIS